MARRIVGQCNQADFKAIEHLALALDNPEMLDTSTLTSGQKFAFHFLALTIEKKVPWKMLGLISEVLFWGNDKDVSAMEVKFVRDQSKVSEIVEFRALWYSQ